MALDFLTEEEAAKLLASTRERGAYKTFMAEFVESGEQGANASKRFPAKKSASIYQGLNLVKKDQDMQNIRIINHEDTVYVIRTDLNGSEEA